MLRQNFWWFYVAMTLKLLSATQNNQKNCPSMSIDHHKQSCNVGILLLKEKRNMKFLYLSEKLLFSRKNIVLGVSRSVDLNLSSECIFQQETLNYMSKFSKVSAFVRSNILKYKLLKNICKISAHLHPLLHSSSSFTSPPLPPQKGNFLIDI